MLHYAPLYNIKKAIKEKMALRKWIRSLHGPSNSGADVGFSVIIKLCQSKI